MLVAASLTLAGTNLPVLAQDSPKLSSSLAKNLWRQAHFYFEEGMDAKAIRACKELQAWARENNEPAVEKEMSEMLAALHARQQAPAAAQTAPARATAAIQTSLPACGYGSVSDVPSHLVAKVITNTPGEFLTCRDDQDCVAAYNFCGTSKAVNKPSQECYKAVARHFEVDAGCSPMDLFDATPLCHNQICMLQFQ